jgi:hypothetical protein
MKITINAIVWLFISFLIGVMSAEAFGHGGIIMLYAGLLLGVCGAVVQGVFVGAGYFGLRVWISLPLVAILTLIATILTLGVLLVETGLNLIWSEILFFTTFLFVPSIALTILAYFVTQPQKQT